MSRPPRFPAVCKYEPSHGEFADPIAMSQHYRAEHADVHVVNANPPSAASQRSVVCRVCRAHVKRHSFRRHVQHVHPSRLAEVDDLYDEVEQPSRAVVRAPRPAPPPPPELPPLVADDIVQMVVEQLADPHGLMPVRHLSAVFEWRDSTVTFLRSVRGEP